MALFNLSKDAKGRIIKAMMDDIAASSWATVGTPVQHQLFTRPNKIVGIITKQPNAYQQGEMLCYAVVQPDGSIIQAASGPWLKPVELMNLSNLQDEPVLAMLVETSRRRYGTTPTARTGPVCTHDISYEDDSGILRCHDCGLPLHDDHS